MTDLFHLATSVETLQQAWHKVRSNDGCAGGDGETVARFSDRARSALPALSRDLRSGEYRPRDYRLLGIRKRDGGIRPLAVPSVQDRIAHTAVAQTLQPVLDPTFVRDSYGYRPGKSVAMAVRRIAALRRSGFTTVVEADIVKCFERIPHDPLLTRLDETLAPADPALSDLIALWLEHAGSELGTEGMGLPQGSSLSPLLSNLYLDRLDDAFAGKDVRLVRFADDFVILCKSRQVAEAALTRAEKVLGAVGLEMKSDKSGIVEFNEGFEYLGHIFVRSLALKSTADPEEDPLELMRGVALLDKADAKQEADAEQELAAGLDRGDRVLYIVEPGRHLAATTSGFEVQTGEGRALIAVAHARVDRIELGPDAEADAEAVRQAIATDTALDFVRRDGTSLARLSREIDDRAALHLAQAACVLDPEKATALAFKFVAARIANQRTRLRVLNRRTDNAEVAKAAVALGRCLRKLSLEDDIPTLRGKEGAAAAVYWPALGLLAEGLVPAPFRRTRPAEDVLNATINYLTALLERDVRAAVLRAGLHPGFGVLHAVADRNDACIWDLMEGFRALMSEGLAVSLFNRRRLRADMFETNGTVRISTEGRRAIIVGYESLSGTSTRCPHTDNRRTWRRVMYQEALAFAQSLQGNKADFMPARQDS